MVLIDFSLNNPLIQLKMFVFLPFLAHCRSPSTMTCPAVLCLAVILAVFGRGKSKEWQRISFAAARFRPVEEILSSVKEKSAQRYKTRSHDWSEQTHEILINHMFRAQPVFSASLKDFAVVLLTGFNIFMKCNSAGVCFFLSWVEEKLPLMWRFHNPPSVIYQGINTHTETDSKQKKYKVSSYFCESVLFLSFPKSGPCLRRRVMR